MISLLIPAPSKSTIYIVIRGPLQSGLFCLSTMEER